MRIGDTGGGDAFDLDTCEGEEIDERGDIGWEIDEFTEPVERDFHKEKGVREDGCWRLIGDA